MMMKKKKTEDEYKRKWNSNKIGEIREREMHTTMSYELYFTSHS